MKRFFTSVLFASAPLLANASESGIRFDTIISEAGKTIATPSVWVPFDQEAVIEVSNKVRVIVIAVTPTGDTSKVKARMYYFSEGVWVLDWDTAMNANITKTPSFEKDMGDKTHRVVVMPRKAVKPTSSGG
jgi:hypothetical protein